MATEPDWLTRARNYIGVREVPGKGDAPLSAPTDSDFWRNPSGVQTLIQRALTNSEFFLSLIERERATEDIERERIPLVVVLAVAMNPSAILRRVVSIIVDAINLVGGRGANAHINKETREACVRAVTVKPSVTNANSAPTVIPIPASMRDVAATFHVGPNSLRWGISHSVDSNFRTLRSAFQRESTRSAHRCLAFPQIERERRPDCSALAAQRIAPPYLPSDGPFAESFANKVFHGM